MWAVGVILYFSLRGRPPFFDPDPERLGELIRTCTYDGCEGEGWQDVSESAKDLVRRLLVADYRSRLSAGAVLRHPWVAQAAAAEAGKAQSGAAQTGQAHASAPEAGAAPRAGVALAEGSQRGSSFKLQGQGLAKLASHRELSGSVSVLRTAFPPTDQDRTGKPHASPSPHLRRGVSFANETWGPQTVEQSQ